MAGGSSAFQKRLNRFFLDNKQFPCLITIAGVLSVLVVASYLYASQSKAAYNEELGVTFSEVVALQELLDSEKETTNAIGRNFAALTERLLKTQAEFSHVKEYTREKQAMIEDLQL